MVTSETRLKIPILTISQQDLQIKICQSPPIVLDINELRHLGRQCGHLIMTMFCLMHNKKMVFQMIYNNFIQENQ